MTYVLPEKLKDLNPYDPVTEDFRIHLDANESFCEVPENIRTQENYVKKQVHIIM